MVLATAGALFLNIAGTDAGPVTGPATFEGNTHGPKSRGIA